MPSIKPTLPDVTWPDDEEAIGIVGVAPWATLDFCRALYSLVDAKKDWHYPRLIIDANSKIPSRGRYFELGETDPSKAIRETIHELTRNGAGVVVVPCNTAHILYSEWTKDAPVPVPHIMRASANRVLVLGGRVVTVFESSSLRKHETYKDVISKTKGICFYPITDEEAELVSSCIAYIKVNGCLNNGLLSKVMALLEQLREKGVDTIILGCTELSVLMPLIVKAGMIGVDSNVELAREAVSLAKCGFLRSL